MKIIYNPDTQKVPIKLWLNDIEDGAMKQAINLSNLPFVFKHVAIMPDSHQGYGMPIGGVIATEGVVIPNAVGVDIGCGMCSLRTSLTDITKEDIKKIFGGSKEYQGGIRSYVPVGFNKHSKKQDESLMPPMKKGLSDILISENTGFKPSPTTHFICNQEYENALKSLGTLGGGNHFIEIQRGNDGYVYVMIHSGSRNLGKQVADYHNKVAIDINKKWYSNVPKEHQLAFLPIDSQEGQNYLREMQYCVEFALANRRLMMNNIKKCISVVVPDVTFPSEMINIAHNYATMENHFGKNVMVHRKGATLARQDTIGIIPGSQGTKSYIVQGLGNEESFMSCSHGAGRKMSRTKACNELNLEEEIRKMNEQGIIHGIRTKNDLDEASGAYKDIDEVMNNQKDLVKILVELIPLAVIKG